MPRRLLTYAVLSSFLGLVSVFSVGAEPRLAGQVRLDTGEPVAHAQVRLFDATDPRRFVGTTTDEAGHFALSWAALSGRARPTAFALGPNYPNPFNPSTIIPYQLPQSAPVRLEVFNLLGQRLATLVDGERPAGFHTATWQATDASGRAVGAGVYIYRMRVGAESQTGRMVLVDGQAGVAASVWPGASGGASDGESAQVYGLIVSGDGLVPYVDSAFRIEAGMAPVELVVSAGPYSAGKATDDDCAFCDLFGAFDDAQEEEDETEEAAETDSTSSEGGPDLIVQPPSASAVVLTPGEAFTLHVTVENQGDGQAAATMLRYYRSNNSTITASDTEVGTSAVDALDASATSAESIALTASVGVERYYGACVASVSGESNTDNNCSSAVRINMPAEEEDTATAPEEDETPEKEESEEVSLEPQIYNDNVFVLPVEENLVDFSDKSLPVQDYAVRFYEHFSDDFDFLVFIPNYFFSDLAASGESWGVSAIHHRVSNDVKGIGLSNFSYNFAYGSAGKLQGVIKMWAFADQDDPSTPTELFRGPFLHEVMHRWGNYIIKPYPHWGFSTANGLLGGFPDTSLVDHGDGRYSGRSLYDKPFGPIELYLAGLIPPEEVPNIWIAEGEGEFREEGDYWSGTITADRVRTYMIEDIIAEHGPRIPDHTQSQKNFRAAVILLIGKDYPVDTRRLEWLSKDVSAMGHAGSDQRWQSQFYNFYEATGGRATLTMDGLSSSKRRGAAKRLVPSSFGTPPPPIHWDHWNDREDLGR